MEYIEFTVVVAAGFIATATQLNFIWDRSPEGPSAVTLTYSTDNFASALASASGLIVRSPNTGLLDPTVPSNFTTLDFDDLTLAAGTTTFRLYGYGATGSAGTGGFDTVTGATTPNVNFLGTVTEVPEPSTWAAGVLIALALGWVHCRRVSRAGISR